MKNKTYKYINTSVAFGITVGLYFLIITLVSLYTGYAEGFLKSMSYFGYSVSPMGAVIGSIYAFLDGFAFCYIFLFLNNILKK